MRYSRKDTSWAVWLAYQAETAELYGQALAAMREGDLVSAEPDADWHPDD